MKDILEFITFILFIVSIITYFIIGILILIHVIPFGLPTKVIMIGCMIYFGIIGSRYVLLIRW